MPMPENKEVSYYMDNWMIGYNFGTRDARKLAEIPTDFSTEKYGFMSGYILGFLAVIEKTKGRIAALEQQAKISRMFQNKQIKRESEASSFSIDSSYNKNKDNHE